ncbi:Phage-related protein [Gemella morbillorum]|uniref:tape measure protein n=1 Tax=Gemella morbillorum TaxID=29391 RepID=UPI000DA3AC00|nr:tape measure protein [Gemella morbillorum]UBH81443.1 tape measure protein [Gemella morbillorum]SQH55212.1 Phage-related protein [Gemella morbillorum]
MAEGKVKIDVNLNEKGATAGIGRLKGALNGLEGAGNKVGSVFKSVLGANLVNSAIVGSIRGISNSVKSMTNELNSSAKAWKTFEGNMQMIGKSADEIAQAKSVMQDYATKTIYSASDMASTYSQLAAVGIKETDKLVTGFGGLAAAAENPQQAMKTLSTQATQMAAKPKVAWQDFKLMMEQTPAGMAAVAKEMGMSLAELVKGVQDGTVKTEDFFNAIKKVGNNDHFSKMATQFKTVDQAIDGARESIANKLMPTFEKFNKFGIKAIVGITEALEKLDFGALADKVGKFLDGIDIEGIINGIASSIRNVVTVAKELWKGLNDSGAISAVISAFKNINGAISNVIKSLANSGVISTVAQAFGVLVNVIARVVGACAKFTASLPPSVISGIAYALLAIVGSLKAIKLATKGLNFIKSLNPFKLFKKNAVSTLESAGKGISKSVEGIGKGVQKASQGLGDGIRKALQGVSSVIRSLGTAVATASKGIGTGLAIAFRGLGQAIAIVPPTTWLALGAGIALVCVGLALLGTQGDGVAKVFQALGSAVSQVILALGTGLSAVLVSLGSVIQSVGTAIQSVGNGIRLVFEGIGTIIQSVGIAIKGTLEGLALAFTGFGNGVRLALEGVASVIQSVGTAIKSVLEGLGTAFEKFGTAVKTVCEGVKTVIDSIGDSIRKILDGVANVIKSIGESAEKAGNGFRLFAEGVKTLVDLNLGDLVATLAATALGVGKISAHAGEMTTAGTGMQTMAQGLLSLGEAANSVQGALTSIPTLITNLNTSLNGLPATLISTSTAVQTFSVSVVASLAGLMSASGYISSFNSEISTMGSTLSNVNGVVSGFTSTLASVGSAMGGLATSISSAMSSAQSAVQGTCQQMTSILQQTASRMAMEGRKAGQESGKNIAEGLRSNEGNVRSAMESIKNTIQSIGQSIVPVAQNIGAQVSNGVAQGMYSALGAVTAAANAIISEVDRALRAKAQIHSPSRLTDKRTGRHLTGGVARGMVKNMPVLNKALDMYQRTISAFKPKPPEAMLSLGTNSLRFAPVGSNSNSSVTNNKTNNYGSLLHIENLHTNSKEDVRKIYNQIKFLVKEEEDRL